MKLKIEYVSTASLQAYDRNAKIHTPEQVQQIVQSINDFGFNDPIAITGNIVVEGHGRLLAAQKLGLKEVPIVRLDHLTEAQRRAYTLVHNQLTMNTGNDIDILNAELEALEAEDIDMSVFGLELPEDTEEDDYTKNTDGYYGDAREATYNAVNLNQYDETRTTGFYQMPIIQPCTYIPERLIGFNYAKSSGDKNTGIHFFVDDYQFERIWNSPAVNIERLRPYQCVLTPDFSLYMDMPMAMKIWNVYRSRLIGQMCQDAGLNVIPTLSWAEPATYEFCFDGIEPGGTVAVSTVGVMRNPESREVWCDGMEQAMKKTKPSCVVCYGARIDFDFGDCKVKYIEARKW